MIFENNAHSPNKKWRKSSVKTVLKFLHTKLRTDSPILLHICGGSLNNITFFYYQLSKEDCSYLSTFLHCTNLISEHLFIQVLIYHSRVTIQSDNISKTQWVRERLSSATWNVSNLPSVLFKGLIVFNGTLIFWSFFVKSSQRESDLSNHETRLSKAYMYLKSWVVI